MEGRTKTPEEGSGFWSFNKEEKAHEDVIKKKNTKRCAESFANGSTPGFEAPIERRGVDGIGT